MVEPDLPIIDPHHHLWPVGGALPEGVYLDEAFRAGVRRLGQRNLTYDTWHYHCQNAEVLSPASRVGHR